MSNLDRYPLLPSDVGSLYFPVGRPAPGGFGTRGASILFLAPTGSTSVGSRAVASGSVGVISKRGPPVAPTGILGNESPISPCRGRPTHIRGTSTVAVPNSYEPRGWMRRERSRSSCSRADSLILLFVGLAVAFDLPPGGTFIDDDGNLHEGFIEGIAAEGITRGCNPPGNDRYCPTSSVTRGAMAAFLARAVNLPAA